MTFTKQEISDITISLETMMEQLNDDIHDIQDYYDAEMKVKYYRLWDLRNKLNK
jgi:hypothetical protein